MTGVIWEICWGLTPAAWRLYVPIPPADRVEIRLFWLTELEPYQRWRKPWTTEAGEFHPPLMDRGVVRYPSISMRRATFWEYSVPVRAEDWEAPRVGLARPMALKALFTVRPLAHMFMPGT